MTEHRTIEEGYQSATNSGNLAVDLEHRTDADWMIASGWSHRQLGADLMRLQSEWSSPNRQKNKRHDEANVRESIRQLRSLPKTQEKLIYCTRRAWQEWEQGNRKMHPAFFELWLQKRRR